MRWQSREHASAGWWRDTCYLRWMIGPAYVCVPDGRKLIQVTAFRRSQRMQIVRIGGAHVPNKLSTIYEFTDVELRPKHGQSAEIMIPAQNACQYWLAVQVFSYDSSGWSQSAIRSSAPLRVPAVALAFDDRGLGLGLRSSDPSLSLRIVFSVTPFTYLPSVIAD